ncbi:MAG: radical SAM protein [Burkholderiales bacterium]|nr:radical SAM protein [Burkholderiales bacterium]
MTSPYRIAVNVEWSSKCNARCAMCPREAITHPEIMSIATWKRILERIRPEDVFRAVIAGYGEPTTHPRFFDFIDALRGHPARFDLVSNGQLLDAGKLAHLDGAIGFLMVSFSSIDPAVYRRVHVNLDQRRVMTNLVAARATLKHTRLGVSLTPMPECLASLPDTIAWLKAQGVDTLTMSPTLYNRGGNLTEHATASLTLRRLIERHGLHAQDLDFVPSVREVWGQWRSNRFKCVPRNVDLFVAASGEYLYCYNDIGHRNPIGHVATDSVRAVLRRREAMAAIASLCDGCNMRGRYRAPELIKSAIAYARASQARARAG